VSAYDFVQRPEATQQHLHADDVIHAVEGGARNATRWASLMLRDKSYLEKWPQHTNVGPASRPIRRRACDSVAAKRLRGNQHL